VANKAGFSTDLSSRYTFSNCKIRSPIGFHSDFSLLSIFAIYDGVSKYIFLIPCFPSGISNFSNKGTILPYPIRCFAKRALTLPRRVVLGIFEARRISGRKSGILPSISQKQERMSG